MKDNVLISVDPHKASATVAVLDPTTRTPLEGARFANTADGYVELRRFARRWRCRSWAIEGCRGAGRSLAQRLVADGEDVVDVPAKLAARVRVFSQGHGRKTDRDDAVSIGLAALDGVGLQQVRLDDHTVTLRLLCDRRAELVALRTQSICRLHRLLAELTPGGVRRELTAGKAAAVLARLRPRDEPGRIRRQVAVDHLSDVRSLDRRIKQLEIQLRQSVMATGTTLIGLFGVGPVIAARILAEVGDISRFPSKDHFASYNGTAPIDVSSGEQTRHRLSRAGNRRINHSLHIVAVTQLRHPTSPGRAYYERKRLEGKTPKEALRCLKRRLSDVVYRQLVIDAEAKIATCASPTTPRPTPPTSTSPTASSHRAARASKPTPRPASGRSSPSTGKTAASLASRSSTPARRSTKTSSTRRRSSTNPCS